ncbi:MAG: hypothetical protein R6V01_03030 [Thermoplasmatota archaeon]
MSLLFPHGATTTDPLNHDTDFDGLYDGWDNSNQNAYLDTGEVLGEDHNNSGYFAVGDWGDGKIEGDTNNNGYWEKTEVWTETSPNDMDSDDDGISDYDETFHNGTRTHYWYEDYDGDGKINAVDPDSDNDLLYDGLERGYRSGDCSIDTDLSRPYFIADTDHCTTNPYDPDTFPSEMGASVLPDLGTFLRNVPGRCASVPSSTTDGDSIEDGIEDANKNGKIDGDNGDGIYGKSEIWTELNPNNPDTDNDSFTDYNEKQWGYDPLSNDTDGDGLLDNIEDLNGNGIRDGDETNAILADTDGDGLSDKEELDGWNVIILFGVTLEEKMNYLIESDPNNPDTDGDGLIDLYEMRNLTDPTSDDTDNDGLTDIFEIENDINSSPTIIDGNPPEIYDFDSWYSGSDYKGIGPLKIPTKMKLNVKVSVGDPFGVNWVNVHIHQVGSKKYYAGNVANTTHTFEWSISGLDKIKKAVWDGFSINITAQDRNCNLGYREEEQPGIAKMIMLALLGALLAFAKFIAELASGIFNWIYSLAEDMLRVILTPIEIAINEWASMLKSIINKHVGFGDEEGSKGSDINFATLANEIWTFLLIPIIALQAIYYLLAFLELVIKGVPISSLAANVASIMVGVIVSIIIAAIMEGLTFALDDFSTALKSVGVVNKWVGASATSLAIVTEIAFIFAANVKCGYTTGLSSWTISLASWLVLMLSTFFSSIEIKIFCHFLSLVIWFISILHKIHNKADALLGSFAKITSTIGDTIYIASFIGIPLATIAFLIQ